MFFKKKRKELPVCEADKGGFEFQLELKLHLMNNRYIQPTLEVVHNSIQHAH
jgi:hypothetical protein